MISTELVMIDVVASVSPPPAATAIDPAAEFANYLGKLLALKGSGYEWMRTYEIPGKKMLRQIVGGAYAVFVSIEKSTAPHPIYERLIKRLRSENVRLHADAPNSAVVIRTVFPTLDPSRVSKYARALDAAKQKAVEPAKFVEFVDDAGGFEKIRLAPIAVMVPAKVAKPESFKMVARPIDDAELAADDLNDEEMDQLEYGDELHGLFTALKAKPIVSVDAQLSGQQSRLAGSKSSWVVLVAELQDGKLNIFDQVPYLDESLTRAYRLRYPTCNDIRAAASSISE